jgi:enediyne biosynthesis protein E4
MAPVDLFHGRFFINAPMLLPAANNGPRKSFVWMALASILMLAGCGPENHPTAVESNKTAIVSENPVLFREITKNSGLTFTHDSSARGEYFMPEQMGSGAALFDYDRDGKLDIYLLQCGGPNSSSRNRLFHQETDGAFKDVSEGSGLDVAGFGMGVATGDVDNDGWVDLVITEYGGTRLFLNKQGRFEEIVKAIDNPGWGTAVSFIDYDRDGWLDLAVGNYGTVRPRQKCYDATGAREYCGPQTLEGSIARLYHNRGALGNTGASRFEDVTIPSGFAKAAGAALGILCADFDGDRWPDIFIADDSRPNRLFMNQKDGAFREEAAIRGAAYTGMGASAANMGVAVGDVNGDGLFDFFVTHLATEQHTLWLQGPRGIFQDQTGPLGLANPAWKATGFGAALADFDQDGILDLAFVNGGIRRGNFPGPRLEGLKNFWFPYAQRNQLFVGRAGKFVDISEANPDLCGRAGMGRGLAIGDVDNDGALDLLVTNTDGPAQLFRNTAPRRGNWLRIRAIDAQAGGRDALGAEISVHVGAKRYWRLVQTSFSYLSASDPRAHFGLGAAQSYDKITVLWPDGTEEVFPSGPAGHEVVLTKGAKP